MHGWNSARALWLEIMATKAYRDNKGRHVRIYCDLLDSPAWCALSKTSRSLFLDLRSFVGPTNNGNISAALSLMRKKGWNSSSTLADALFELQVLGFIAKTRNTIGVENGSRVCCLYRFTDLSTYEFPKLGIEAHSETHDYRNYPCLAAAKQALQEATASRRIKALKKVTIRKTNRIGSVSEPTRQGIDSDSEHVASPSVRKLKAVKTA